MKHKITISTVESLVILKALYLYTKTEDCPELDKETCLLLRGKICNVCLKDLQKAAREEKNDEYI